MIFVKARRRVWLHSFNHPLAGASESDRSWLGLTCFEVAALTGFFPPQVNSAPVYSTRGLFFCAAVSLRDGFLAGEIEQLRTALGVGHGKQKRPPTSANSQTHWK